MTRTILMRMFGRPQGLPGRLGGRIMAALNRDGGAWVTDLLHMATADFVLEVGFGPGVVVQRLASLVPVGHVAGIDQSLEMIRQARARNAESVRRGHVDLRQGSVDSLPFADGSFDRALAINSMQVWPDPIAGLREILRVLKPAGSLALGFTPQSGQPKLGVAEKLLAAGFARAEVSETDRGFCVVGSKA